jgi:serine/threonine protein kinase
LATELEELLGPKNGRLIPEPKQHHYDPFNISFTPEVTEFHQSNQAKVSVLSDIYSIGAILYKLLIGSPPDIEISDHITKKRMWDKSPDQNVFHVPYFFENYILSNDMCYIVSKLLCGLPKYRYLTLSSLKKDLMKLKENIYSTPTLLRRVL